MRNPLSTDRVSRPGETAFEAMTGPAAAARLSQAFASTQARLAYLKAWASVPGPLVVPGRQVPDGQWMACHQLLDDRKWLSAVVRSTGERLGSPDQAVAASLFVLGYSYRVVTLATASLLLSGVLPTSEPEGMAVALSSSRPALFSYPGSRALVVGTHCERRGLRALVDATIEGHVRRLVDSVTSCTRVGRRLLWGNVAASCATAFRTMEGLLGPHVRVLGTQFFELVPIEMQGQGSFTTLSNQGRTGWFWERRNCCLNYKLPKKITCSDCSLTPKDERRASYLASLCPPVTPGTGTDQG